MVDHAVPADALAGLRGRKALLVASTGGHLAQAVRWRKRLDLRPDSHFVTFDGPQSRSLVGEQPHTFLPYVAPRDWRGVLKTARELVAIQRTAEVEVILSTGAGVALSCLAPNLLGRVPFYYLESVSRFMGPSLTGRVLARTPWVHRGTQHPQWSSRTWPFVGSLLDDYRLSEPHPSPRSSGDARDIFVTLGTIRPYRFDRLVDAVSRALHPEDRVTWQLGATTRTGLQGHSVDFVSRAEYKTLALGADAVITQAGIGAIMDLLDMGVSPVVVPRRMAFAEHVDDHQLQAARAVGDRNLALTVDAGDVSRESFATRPRVLPAD